MADTSNLGFGGDGGNPYLNGQISSTMDDMTRAWNHSALPAYNNAMVNSGSFGNSGVDQMTQDASRQYQQSLGRVAGDMRANNYWQDQNFNRGVYNDTFAQNQQNFQNGLNLMGVQNSANSQNLGFGTQIQNTPMQYYQGFSNTANSIGQGYGNATSNMSAQGSPLMGALGGYQLGSQLFNGYRPSPSVNYGGASTNGNQGYTDAGVTYNNPSAYTA